MTQFLLLGLFGAGVGALSGMLGIGGGVVLVPGLIFLFGFNQTEAQGTSLALLSLPILIFAAAVYYQHGLVRVPAASALAVGFVVGALAGAVLVNYQLIPREALRIVFGVLLLYVGFVFVFDPSSRRPAAALPAGLATVALTILAWLLRRRFPVRPKHSPTPGQDVEYHL